MHDIDPDRSQEPTDGSDLQDGSQDSHSNEPLLNPAQQETLTVLGATREQRPTFDLGLRDELREQMSQDLAPVAEEIRSKGRGMTLYLSKYQLSTILGCERKFMGERGDPFAWSPATARGTVTHKAIELSIHRGGEAKPLDLTERAMASLERSGGSGIGDYLRSADEDDIAELRAIVSSQLSQFRECFPPLSARWTPVTDSPLRHNFHGQTIVISGKPDLCLGKPEGNVSGKVIIDFKSGGFSPNHREDLRFYALLEALRILPPRLVATYYLDSATMHTEQVTLELLHGAAARVVDAAHRYVELALQKVTPEVHPGPACRWCSLRPDCPEGFLHYESQADLI